MKLTRERKLYVAVLAAGVLALVGDRLFFAPSGAGAAVQPPSDSLTDVPSAPRAGKPAAELPAPSGPSFSQRISSAASASAPGGRDAFRPGETWPRPHVNDPSRSTPQDTFDTFLQKQHLTTVLLNKDVPMFARINKEIWRVGDVIDGYALIVMDKNGVEFQSPSGERRRLDLPTPKLQQQHREPTADKHEG